MRDRLPVVPHNREAELLAPAVLGKSVLSLIPRCMSCQRILEPRPVRAHCLHENSDARHRVGEWAQDRQDRILSLQRVRSPCVGNATVGRAETIEPVKPCGNTNRPATNESMHLTSATCSATHPPMSEPTPKGLPFMPIRAPSPPEDPPHVRFRLDGFDVLPNTLLYVSAHYKENLADIDKLLQQAIP